MGLCLSNVGLGLGERVRCKPATSLLVADRSRLFCFLSRAGFLSCVMLNTCFI